MKKFIITEEQRQDIAKVIQPLNFLNQPIPSSLGAQIINILNSLVELPEENKVEKDATE